MVVSSSCKPLAATSKREAARFNYPRGVAIDSGRGVALVTDSSNHALRQVDLTSGAVTTLAGLTGSASGTVDGVGEAARFHSPTGVAIDSGHGVALVADWGNHAMIDDSE